MKCTYKLNTPNGAVEFNNPQDVVKYVGQNPGYLTNDINFSKELSGLEQDSVIEKIQSNSANVTLKLFDESGNPIHDYVDDSGTVLRGVSTTIGEYLTSIGKGFNKDEYVKTVTEYYNSPQADTFIASSGYTREELLEQLNRRVESWGDIAQVGTKLHKVAELVLSRDIKTYDEYIAALTDGPEFQGQDVRITNEAVGASRADITNLINSLNDFKNKLPANSKILTEVSVKDPYSDLAGTIDVLVIHADGSVDIYDWKASPKYWQDWNKYKNETINYQQATYRGILENMGVKVRTLNIVPIGTGDIVNGMASNVEVSDPIDLEFSRGLTRDSDIVKAVEENIIKPNVPVDAEQIEDNDVYDKVNESLTHIFPESTTDNEEDISDEQLIFKYRYIIQKDADGNEYFIDNVPSNKTYKKKIYIKDKLSDLRSYHESRIKYKKNHVSKVSKFFEKNFNQLKDDGDIIEWDLKNEYRNLAMMKVLQQYIEEPGWRVIRNASAEKLGIVVLYNEKTNQIDLISPTVEDMDKPIDTSLGKKGKTLLGNLIPDSKLTKERVTGLLDATNANLQYLKQALFITHNEELFNGSRKIGQLKVINDVAGSEGKFTDILSIESAMQNLGHIISKVPLLAGLKNRVNAKDYKHDSLVSYIEFISGLISTKTRIKGTNIDESIVDAYQKEDLNTVHTLLKERVKSLSEYYSRPTTNRNTPDFKAYLMAQEALLQLNGINLEFEEDIANMGNILNNNATYITPDNIRNKMFQQLLTLVKQTTNSINEKYNQYNKELAQTKVFKNLFDTLSLTSRYVVGDTTQVFTKLIETKDKDGNNVFRLKKEDTPGLTKAEREFIKYFSNKISEIRLAKMTSERIRKLTPSELDAIKYDIPLMKASIQTARLNKSIGEIATEYKDSLLSIGNFFNESDQLRENIEKQSLRKKEAVDYFAHYENQTNRDIKLSDAETKMTEFESNLYLVLNDFMLNDIRKTEIDDILPVTNAIQNMIAFSDSFGFRALPNTKDLMQTYINRMFFNIPQLKKETIKFQQVGKVIRQTVSTLALFGNPVTTVTQILQGEWTQMTRVAQNYFDEGDLYNFKDLTKAHSIVFNTTSPKMIDFMNEMNHKFRINNMDVNHLSQKYNKERNGILFTSRYLRHLNSVPDFYHRMKMFFAQAIHDGTVEFTTTGRLAKSSAYQLDKNGVLVYDETKDKRFNLLFKPNPDKTTPQYKEQLALYDFIKAELVENGLQEIDQPLVQAYTPTQTNSFKAYADRVWGAYDRENRLLLEDTTWGPFFTQFKSWLSAKKEQYWLETNQSQQEMLMKKVYNEETGEFEGFKYEGRMMEGIFQTLLFVGNDVFENKRAPWETWKDMDDFRKANLARLGADLGLWGLLALIGSMIDFDELKKEDRNDLYILGRVFQNSYKDLWIGNNIQAIGIDNKSPIVSVSYLMDIFKKVAMITTGERDPSYIMTSIGLTRPMYYMLKED